MKIFNSVLGDEAKGSLLQRDESNAVKGLLILIIVLAHNKYLMQGGFSNRYLYSFHIYSFFLLPFLYNFKPVSLTGLAWKKFKRFYIPYTASFLLLIGIVALQNRTWNVPQLLLTWICGSQRLFTDSLGIGSFLWFIPTMFSLLFIRWLYYNSGKTGRMILLLLSAVCLIGFAYLLHPFLIIWKYSPLGCFLAMAMLLPAVICRYCFTLLNAQCVNLLFFVLVIAIMIVYPLSDYSYTYLTINRLFCPVIIFLFILSMREYLSCNGLLIDMGKYSFGIYLIHIFIYNAFYRVLDGAAETGLFTGILLFCVVLSISYFIARIPFVKSFFHL